VSAAKKKGLPIQLNIYNLKAFQNGKEIIFNSFGLLRWSVLTREPFSLQRSSVVTVK